MRIIVIGAEGDIGRAACAELSARHDVIKVVLDHQPAGAEAQDQDAAIA